MPVPRLAAIIVVSLFLTSCFWGFVYDRTLTGRYRLVGVDTSQDISLCWSLDNGSCVGDGLPGPTVVRAGFNDKYVVAAVDPTGPVGPPDAATKYYYIIRAFEDQRRDGGLPYKGIRGPLNKAEYAAEKIRLGLPEFSWLYEDR